MEHCRSPDGITSVSVRPYYTMLSRVYLALAMGFLVIIPDNQSAIQSQKQLLAYQQHQNIKGNSKH